MLEQIGVFILLMLFLAAMFFGITRNTWKMWDKMDEEAEEAEEAKKANRRGHQNDRGL